jgi:hypothetical protein
MILVTDEPMEGVAFDVQDHARGTGTIWTGTHGEIISLDLHGDKEPTRWMLRPHQGAEIGQRLIRDFAQEKKRTFYQRGGLTHFQWDVGSRWPRMSSGGL